ncbi:hypothetical protein BC940DRAFT_83466 [Gongronella butleri]|nr:hypothetical protein BC940DRAFT_83466 [Gongronella butleri]
MAALPDNLELLRQAFEIYDHDGDGMLRIDEFKHVLMKIYTQMKADEADRLAHDSDLNKDQMIDFDEFSAALGPTLGKQTPTPTRTPLTGTTLQRWYTSSSMDSADCMDDELRACFQAFDTNNDGLISRAELKRVMFRLGDDLSEAELNDMMNEADANRDGYIDFDEFKRLC